MKMGFNHYLILVCFFSLVFALAPPAQANGDLLTLDEAWQKMVEFDPNLKAVRELINEGKGGKITALSAFLPQISGEVRIRRLGKDMGWTIPAGRWGPFVIPDTLAFVATDKTVPRYSASLDQMIFDSGKSIARYSSAKYGLLAADHTVFARTQQRAVDLVMAYSNYYLALKNLEVARLTNSAYAELERVARHLYEQQMVPITDVLSAEVEHSNARLQVTEAIDGVDVAAAMLASMIGEAPCRVAEPRVPIPPENIPSPSVRAEVKAKAAEEKVSHYEAKAEGLAYLPEVFGRIDVSYADNSYLMNKDQYRFIGGVRVPIFDGRRHWGKRQTAKAREIRHRWEKQALMDSYAVEADDILRAWRRTGQEINVAARNKTKTSENLRIMKERYFTGLAQSLDVRDAVALWSEAAFKYHQVLCQKQITAARLRQAAGVSVIDAGGNDVQ